MIPSTDFSFDPIKKTCICPEGQRLSPRGERPIDNGQTKIYFEGRLSQCKNCDRKHECMRNPSSADHRKGNGRQVSFILKGKPTYTDWMKVRVDRPMEIVLFSTQYREATELRKYGGVRG